MPAYIIVDNEIHDPKAYEEYRKLVVPTLQKFGAKFLVRGGDTVALEGGWKPKRLVVLEFESAAKARQWYNSEDYRHAKEIRMKASTGNVVLVEGL